MNALLIDDSRTARRILGRHLTKLGFAVSEASNGQEGLQALAGDHPAPDLVMVDYNMPVLDGLGFVQQVRKDRTHDRVPLVMVTSLANTEDILKVLDAGANDYIMKPCTASVVEEKLRSLGVLGEGTP